MPRKRRLGPLYMPPDVFDYADECPTCLRWYVPFFPGDSCSHCKNRGVPLYPNRLRSSAIRRGLSLRELHRRTGLAWSGLMEISNGRCAPHDSTKRRLLRGLGLHHRDSKRVFPRPRRPNRRQPVAGGQSPSAASDCENVEVSEGSGTLGGKVGVQARDRTVLPASRSRESPVCGVSSRSREAGGAGSPIESENLWRK